VHVAMTVNGESVTAEVEPRLLLVQFLRDTLNLTGTHIGCETSACGACTVLVDGDAIKSCTLLAVQADDGRITTVEGVAAQADLHPLQEAFLERLALQCGYCTPGMLMSALALLNDQPRPTEAEILRAIDGNLCRCTGYIPIILAIQDAAARMGDEAPPPAAEQEC